MRHGLGNRLLGVEHEFRVLGADLVPIDARTIIDGLPIDGVRCDPGDPHAIRGLHGGVVTADGAEAEIATPPLPCGPGVLAAIEAHAAEAERDLRGSLATGVSLQGYSTHLNVEVRERRVGRVAEALVARWSPALMLLTHDATSPGLLVRPRWRRLEIGGDHLRPGRLAVALAVAATAVARAERRSRPAGLPLLDVRVEPSRQRFGWYVDRHAFGDDLLVAGRAGSLRTRAGGSLSAQQHLERVRDEIRPALAEAFGEPLAATFDAIVDGRLPLACEDPHLDLAVPVTPATVARLPLHYERGDRRVRPHSLTWRTAVFGIHDSGTGSGMGSGPTRWIVVPGHRAQSFLEALHAGRFDAAIDSGRTRRLRW